MFKDLNIAQIGHPILRNKTKDIPINDINLIIQKNYRKND